MKKLFIINSSILIILFSSCNDKIALYSARVLSIKGDTVKNAQVNIVRNGKILKTKPDTITLEDIKKINSGQMVKKIESDILGEIRLAFEDTYFLIPDEIYLLVSKPGYDTSKIEIRWEIVLDDTIMLHPVKN